MSSRLPLADSGRGRGSSASWTPPPTTSTFAFATRSAGIPTRQNTPARSPNAPYPHPTPLPLWVYPRRGGHHYQPETHRLPPTRQQGTHHGVSEETPTHTGTQRPEQVQDDMPTSPLTRASYTDEIERTESEAEEPQPKLIRIQVHCRPRNSNSCEKMNKYFTTVFTEQGDLIRAIAAHVKHLH